MPASRWVGFLLVWCALVILTVEGLRAARTKRRHTGHTPPLPEPVAEAA
jgi:chloramphenicol-sensitive protein RarD